MTPRKPINCEEALRHLFEYLDNELPADGHRDIERHLEICRACFSKAEFERRLKEHLRAVGRQTVRPAFTQRIKALLQAM